MSWPIKTKYILHGGEAQVIGTDNDPFYTEILKNAPENPKVLFVYFGDDPIKKDVHLSGNISQFERVKANKNINFNLATEQDFLNQIKESDIIYIRGGKTGVLMDSLKKFPNLGKYFSGKTISGESAGMNALATYCYSKSSGILKGLGILPLKTIPHFDGNTGVRELEKVGLELEKLYLPNFKFKIYWI